jgi:hypothetical protein
MNSIDNKHATAMAVRTLAFAVLLCALATLTGCGSLRPAVPDAANTAFRTSVQAAHPAAVVPDNLTLDDVKKAFSTLFVETRELSLKKHQQQWTYAEITAAGGFLAVAGQLADKTGLLNTGLGISMLGLSTSQFYDPGKTKGNHLAAEEMFVCMNTELGRVSEAKRVLGMASEEQEAVAAATNAVDDVIGKVDEAIFAYRKKVLTQSSSSPSRADFARFAKEFTDTEEKVTQQEKESATQRSGAMLSLLTQQRLVRAAETRLKDPSAKGLLETDPKKKALNTAVANAEVQLAQAQREAVSEIAAADAKSAGAKFLSLQISLEKCIQDFRPK